MNISSEATRGFGDAIAVLTAMRGQMETFTADPSAPADEGVTAMLTDMAGDSMRLACALTGLASLVIAAVPDETLDGYVAEWIDHWLACVGEGS